MKNKILKGIATVAALSALVAACCMDGVSNVPSVIILACLAYLYAFWYANKEKFTRGM